MNETLEHHGILGMKWGVRRYQNKDGTWTKMGKLHRRTASAPSDARIVGRDSILLRVADDEEDKTYGNRKYFSLNDADHFRWMSDYAYSYKNPYQYSMKYQTIKDLKIAPYTKLGELFAEEYLDKPDFANMVISDTKRIEGKTGYKTTGLDDALSFNIAAETESGKYFVDKLLGLGYNALEDFHGRDTAKDPIIVLDPDKNTKKVSAQKYISWTNG